MDHWRTPARGRIYDEQIVYGHRSRRVLEFTSVPPRPHESGTKRRRAYHENPIYVAIRLRAELDSMKNPSQGRLAQRHGVNRTRICQYMRLLDLPKPIVTFIASKDNDDHVSHISEGALRELLKLQSTYEIDLKFRDMLAQASHEARAAYDAAVRRDG